MISKPRGQILVVVAASLIVLLAVAALVVDLGFSWMLHRQEQNAADPGSIAAARWLKDSSGNARNPFPEAYEEACFYAQANGFFETDTADCSGARAAGQLQVRWPPVSGDFAGDTGAIQVIITDTHPSFFAAVFGQQVATVSTDAVAANTTAGGNSSSLVALQDDCSAGAAGKVVGGGSVRIFPAAGVTDPGGYVQVNSPCGSSTDDYCANGVGSSALSISGTLQTPFARVNGSCTYNGTGANGLVCSDGGTACLDEGAPKLADPLKNLPEPQLAAFPNGVCPDGSASTPTSTSACSLKRAAAICPDDGTGVGICHLTPGVYYGDGT